MRCDSLFHAAHPLILRIIECGLARCHSTSFDLEYLSSETSKGQKVLCHSDDVNILGGGIHTLKKNAEALVAATREIGLEVITKLRTWSCLEIRMQDEITV